jgi:16S rRNA (guanine966-N2)-methyltransferase
MRIVGGKFKGLTLQSPSDQSTRPTSDRVRESVFNILAHGVDGLELEGVRVLDLFAGTGALGFEALSRGARWCHFIEEGTPARGLIRANADKLGVIGQCKIWRRDATDLGPCAPLAKFNLAFLDPPYGKGLGERALASLIAGQWLNAGAIVVLEENETAVVAASPALVLLDTRTYGETKVMFYRHVSGA